MDRQQRIILLLQHMDDYLHEWTDPKTARYSGGTGAGPERRVTCPICDGVKRVRSGNRCGQCWHGESAADHTCEQCPTCKGKGRVWFNNVVGQVVEGPEEAARPRHTHKAQTQTIPGAKRFIEPRGLDAVVHRIAASRVDRDRSGSYKALEAVLDALRSRDLEAWCRVSAVYRHGRSEPRDEDGTAELERGLAFIVRFMPDPIFVPADLVSDTLGVGRRAKERARRRMSRRRAA